MKRIIFLSAILISILVSCSPEDVQVNNQEPTKTASAKELTKETDSNFCITCRDTISKSDVIDSTMISDPVKPRRD